MESVFILAFLLEADSKRAASDCKDSSTIGLQQGMVIASRTFGYWPRIGDSVAESLESKSSLSFGFRINP